MGTLIPITPPESAADHLGMAHQLCLLAGIWDLVGDIERRDLAIDLAARLLDEAPPRE